MKIPLVILGWWWSVRGRSRSWFPKEESILLMTMLIYLGEDFVGRAIKSWLGKEIVALDKLKAMGVTQVGVTNEKA